MSTSFADLAQVKVGSVERPKPVPEGHYEAIFTGPMKEHKAKSGNLAMRFPFKPVNPTDDVDQEALSEMGGIPDKEFTIDFWMSPDARWRFTEFAKGMGASDDLNLIETAEYLATCGNTFTIEAKHRLNENDADAPPFVDWTNPVANS